MIKGLYGDAEAKAIKVNDFGALYTVPPSSEALGFQLIGNVSKSCSLTVPEGARLALIQCEGNDCRWRDDGTDPDADTGMLLPAKMILQYDGSDLTSFRIIQTASSATVNVCYYR